MPLSCCRPPCCPFSAAELSAPGSAFLAVSVTEEVIADIQSKKVGRGSELMGTWKFGTPADPTQVRLPPCLGSEQICGNVLVGSEDVRESAEVNGEQRPQHLAPILLLPLLRLQFLASNGWRVDLVTDRARIAAALDLDPALLAFSSELDKASRSHFIAASVLPRLGRGGVLVEHRVLPQPAKWEVSISPPGGEQHGGTRERRQLARDVPRR